MTFDLDNVSKSLFGYNRQQIKSIFRNQENTIKRMEAEINRLKDKVTSVETQLSDYQEKEKALTQGIIDARMKGEEIVEQSNYQAQKVIDQTNETVVQYKEDFITHSRQLVDTGSYLKNELNAMKEKVQLIIDQYQDLLDSTNFDSLYPKKQMDRLVQQMESYEQEGLEALSVPNPDHPASTMSPEEKVELEKLINDVIEHEKVDSDNRDENNTDATGKLVRFSKANES